MTYQRAVFCFRHDAWEGFMGFPADGVDNQDPISSQVREAHVMTLKDTAEIDVAGSFLRNKVSNYLRKNTL